MRKIMNEFDGLRNEIIAMEEQQRNVWIYMYVIFVALFVLGIEFSYYLFLVTYIILVPFQVVMNRYQWSVSKMSTYIRIFYEKDNHKLNWESLHVFDEYKKYYNKMNSSISGIIRYTGVSQLGFLASGFFIGRLLHDRYNEGRLNFNTMDIILIILSVCLFFLTVILNREYYKDHDDELESVIQKYKDSLKSSQ